jgi:hypothetical protein
MKIIRIPAPILLILALAACAPSQSAIQTAIAGTLSARTAVPTPALNLHSILTPGAPPNLPTPPALVYTVIAAFKSAGLEAEEARPLTIDDYGNAPYLCAGLRFLIPSLGVGNGGRLFVCTNPGEQTALAGYYQSLAKTGPEYFSWVYVRGSIVLQINGTLPETAAQKYEAALP